MAFVNDAINLLHEYDVVGAIIIMAASLLIGKLVEIAIRKGAKRIAKKTKTSLDDHLIHAIEKPVLWGIVVAGLVLALLSINYLAARSTIIIRAATVVGVAWGTWVVIKIIRALFDWYAEEISVKTKTDMDDKYMHIFRRIINIVVYAVAGMLLLKELGVEITPLIASLGIGGLAVALALQDTLANFFSGFYMISDRAVKIGDYVEIEGTGGTVKGHVKDIGWRTSKIRTLTNNDVIVPNSNFANSTVINYQSPNSELSLIVPVGVAYDSDLDKVEQVTLEVIKQTHEEVEGCKKSADPLIRFKEFADSSINLIAILRIKDPVKKGVVRHEFIKRLKRRYDQEGIEIPFPIRTVVMKKSGNEA